MCVYLGAGLPNTECDECNGWDGMGWDGRGREAHQLHGRGMLCSLFSWYWTATPYCSGKQGLAIEQASKQASKQARWAVSGPLWPSHDKTNRLQHQRLIVGSLHRSSLGMKIVGGEVIGGGDAASNTRPVSGQTSGPQPRQAWGELLLGETMRQANCGESHLRARLLLAPRPVTTTAAPHTLIPTHPHTRPVNSLPHA